MQAVDVAIVGGGPVGLGLAIDLGQRGVNVALFERSSKLHRIPKGQNLTQRTGEHFKAWGVYDAVKDAITMPAAYGTGGVTTYRTLLSHYSYDWLIRADVRAFYAADNMRIPQYDLEAVLRERVAQLDSVTVRYDHQVEQIDATDDGVRLRVVDDQGDAMEAVARFAVGCDGARSMVRESAGLTRSLREHFRRMILAVFRSDELHDLLERFPGKSYFNALAPEKEGYWQFFGRVGVGSWFFHTPVPIDSSLDTLDLGEHLAAAVGREIAFETDYLGFWDLRIAIADSYRKGPIFIAGDAAHSHPPYGGYGVNNGFEDVRNLAWKLEAALGGWGGEGLLDSYSAERQPVFESTADDFIARMIDSDRAFVETYSPEKDRDAFETAWAKRAELTRRDVDHYCPNYAGSPIVVGGAGPTSAVGEHSHAARAGYILSPQDDVAERLGSGFNLVSVGDNAEAEAAFATAAGDLGAPLDIVSMAPTAATARWGATLILLRPDRYVAWAGGSVDATRILTTAIGGQQEGEVS